MGPLLFLIVMKNEKKNILRLVSEVVESWTLTLELLMSLSS